MSVQLLEHLRELLAPLGAITARAMFGGHGVYCGGVIFGIVIDDRLYVKVDAQSEPRFRAAGCAPFVYRGQKQPITLSYWSLPEAALDSAEEMKPWAELALAAAMRKPARGARRRRGARNRAREPLKCAVQRRSPPAGE
jgi:DNA transformation protein